jgi:hypothetical protein
METQKNTNPDNNQITQEQRNSVLTPEQTPSWSWGITLVLIALGGLVIFAGFYFGIINV